MSEENSQNYTPFDVSTIRELIQLMDEYEIGEIDLRGGNGRIHLRKNVPIGSSYPSLPPVMGPMPGLTQPSTYPTASANPGTGPSIAPVEVPANNKKLIDVKSDMVGTFYAKPDPSKDDYVKIGSKVNPDTVLGKIEAMKVFNDFTAKCSGTIVEILVKNTDPVDFEEILFRVDPG